MRTPEFRYFYSGKMYEVGQIEFFTDGTIHVNGELVGGTLLEFTGLKDRNGVKIFESDVVECSMSYKGGTLPHMGEIVYDETFGAFGTKNEAGITLLHNHCLHTMKVIGNVFEHPHLLNKEI